MGREIERKFLVKGNSWRQGGKGVKVRQGHLSTDRDRVVRVRTAGGKGFLTIKGKGRGLMRPEYEYEIPVRDAVEILEKLCVGAVIEKTRYCLNHEGLRWEIDEFHGENRGLVVAEVELESEFQEVPRPDWLGEEVSGDPRYLNVNLALRPFREWERGEGTSKE